MRDWNDEFANSAHIPDSENLPELWAARAAAFRQKVAVEENIPYRPLPRQKLDLVRPADRSKGLVVFVHGGFWIRCAKSDWTDLAQGACANGWTVALAGYTLAPEVLTRLEKTVSVSGLHDLRLLQRTAMNDALRLTYAEAEAESPALLRPMEAAQLTCWVGAEERPEFRRQSRVMAAIWDGLAHTKLVEEPGHNHFSILDRLKQSASPIVTELLTD